ncbi:MAG: hypothetical protein WA421_05895 [Nitrososphaeraceae archaeon]
MVSFQALASSYMVSESNTYDGNLLESISDSKNDSKVITDL